MEIYEKIRYYREHTDFSQRNVALKCYTERAVDKHPKIW